MFTKHVLCTGIGTQDSGVKSRSHSSHFNYQNRLTVIYELQKNLLNDFVSPWYK